MKIKYPIGGFAPGNYRGHCASCDEVFLGDKYAKQCEPCAINAVSESNTKALTELQQLKTALEKIKFSNDTINGIINKKCDHDFIFIPSVGEKFCHKCKSWSDLN